MKDKKRELQLLENGLCFILQSIKHLEQSENKNFDPEKEFNLRTTKFKQFF